jgi:hypothetical protein
MRDVSKAAVGKMFQELVQNVSPNAQSMGGPELARVFMKHFASQAFQNVSRRAHA